MGVYERDMELRRSTWNAALKLAAVLSMVAAAFAVGASMVGDVTPTAIVLPVIVVCFAASWIQTGRVQRRHTHMS
jgi:hypothetical protein